MLQKLTDAFMRATEVVNAAKAFFATSKKAIGGAISTVAATVYALYGPEIFNNRAVTALAALLAGFGITFAFPKNKQA